MRVNVYLRNYTTKKGERRYYLVVREAGRKDHQIQLGCLSRKLAEERRVMVLNELLNGSYQRISIARIYFSEFCDKFIEQFAKGAKAPKTVAEYGYQLRKAKAAFPGLRLDEIRREDVERFLGEMPVSNRTKNITLGTLRLLFQKAVDWRYLLRSPAEGIRRWRQEKGGSRPLTQQELGRVLDHATPWERSVIRVMVQTGLRPGELSQLKREDVDWENRLIHVVSNRERKTKNRKSRIIPMSPDLEEEMKVLRESLPNIFAGNPGAEVPEYVPRTEAQRAYLFCLANGRPIESFRKSIGTALRRVGIEGVTPHGLRKTFCSLLARQGVHPKAAQRLLGHSTVSLTMDIYTEVEDDQLRAAVNALPSMRDLQKEKFRVVGETN
ncbi:MAG TPA: site-specific integrase [bacterium]|nr:site-specific integrase [bacterium]